MNEVTITKMDPKEQDARKKRSPAFYIECREKGMLDKEIAKAMGINPSQLSQMKGRWDFIGKSIAEMKTKLKRETKKTRINNKQEPKPEPTPVVEKEMEKPVEEVKAKTIDLDHHNARLNEWVKKFDKEQARTIDLEAKTKDLLGDFTEAKAGEAEALTQVDHLEKELEALKEQLQTKEDRAQGWKEQHDNLMHEYNTLNDKYQALEEESAPRHTITELEDKLRLGSAENRRLRDQVHNLQDQLIEATKRANYHQQRDYHLSELFKIG